MGRADRDLWNRAAEHLRAGLGDVPDVGPRIHDFYLPVLFFALGRLRVAQARPVVIGLQAPQGAGKTTLTRHLLSSLPLAGLRGAGVSIDDFYLTRAEQLAVAAAHPGNPYLEYRGYAGTHDVGLGERTLLALKRLGPAAGGRRVAVPVYDKSAHGGRGDRRPTSEWPRIEGPLDLVFVEGWMLGFTPVDESRLGDPAFVEVNRALAAYDRWHRLLDAMVVARAAEPEFVVRWRIEAEEERRRRGRPGLDRADVEDYVRRFLPAYRTYGGAPAWMNPAAVLTLTLDAARRPVPA
jgi:D-glycerate 3-kinase